MVMGSFPGGSEVKIVFSAVDNASKQIDQINNKMSGFNTAVKTAAQVSGVLITATTAIAAAVGKLTQQYIAYANQVRTVTQITGQSAQAASRLIQVLDDYKISIDSIQAAQRTFITQGRTMTTETLAQLSDEYNNLASVTEKNSFMTQNFGRDYQKFLLLMEAGGTAIRANADAVHTSLIMKKSDLEAARKLEVATEDLNDAWEAARISIGSKLVPALVSLWKFTTEKSIPGWMQYIEVMKKVYHISDQPFGFRNLPHFADMARGNAMTVFYQSVQEGIEGVTGSVDELAKSLANVDWEEQYTGAKEFTDQTDLTMQLLKEQIGSLGAEGALIWEGFLSATGKISPKAAEQFVRVLEIYQHVKDMVAGGIPINVIISYVVGATGAMTTPPPATTTTSTAYWIPDPNNPGHYMVNPIYGHARGTQNATGAFLVGDSETGQRTGWEELVVTTGKAKVYNRHETSRILGARGGWRGPRYPGGIGTPGAGMPVPTGGFMVPITGALLGPGMISGEAQTQYNNTYNNQAAPGTQAYPQSGPPAIGSVAAATTTVAAAAAVISASGEKTAQATQQGTARAAQDAANTVAAIRQLEASIRRMQEATVAEIKKINAR